MKKIFLFLSIAICLNCVACVSNETDEPKAVSKYSIEELTERGNTLKELTKESLSTTSSEWLVSNEDPIIALALEDQATVTIKVITSQIIPRVADDICAPVIAAMKDMGYEQYRITIWHSSNLANEDASGASWETEDGVTGRFVDNERDTVVFQSGVSINDLYSYYDNFGLSENMTTPTEESISELNSTEVMKTSVLLPLEIKEFGYGLTDKNYLYHGIILYNPNESIAYTFPKYRVTARDAEGILLGTSEQTLSIIYPGQTCAFSFQSFQCEEEPSDVQVEVLDPKEYHIRNVSTLSKPTYQPFEIINFAIRDDKLVGEVSNPNDYDYDRISVTVIFRDENNNICGGNTTFVNDLNANSTVPFDIYINRKFITDNFEVYANTEDYDN